MASSEQSINSESRGREVRGDRRITIAIILIGIAVLGLVLWIGLTPELLVNTRNFSYTEPATSATQPSINITNVNGKINLVSWNQNTVLISGRITSRGVGASPDQIKLSESNTNGEINVQASFPNDSLLIHPDAYDVQISISVPENVRFDTIKITNKNGGVDLRIENASNVQVTTVNGGLTVNCTSCNNLVASTSNGPVSATFSTFSSTGQYTLASENGNVGIIVPGGSGFTFDATTNYGSIQVSPSLAAAVQTNSPTHMTGTVNGTGASTVRLSTDNGQVTITSPSLSG